MNPLRLDVAFIIYLEIANAFALTKNLNPWINAQRLQSLAFNKPDA